MNNDEVVREALKRLQGNSSGKVNRNDILRSINSSISNIKDKNVLLTVQKYLVDRNYADAFGVIMAYQNSLLEASRRGTELINDAIRRSTRIK